jgi:hypothetical protein
MQPGVQLAATTRRSLLDDGVDHLEYIELSSACSLLRNCLFTCRIRSAVALQAL